MRSPFGHAEHLVRVALLFLLGVVVFLVAQAAFVPEGFGALGHYRPGALADNRAPAPVHAGRAACVECHPEVPEAAAGGAHAEVRCEACHGPLAAHAGDPEAAPAVLDPGSLCARCHAANVALPASFPAVDVTEHAGEEPCLTCHVAHHPGIE